MRKTFTFQQTEDLVLFTNKIILFLQEQHCHAEKVHFSSSLEEKTVTVFIDSTFYMTHPELTELFFTGDGFYRRWLFDQCRRPLAF